MSSLATVHRRVASGPARTTSALRLLRIRVGTDAALGLGLAAVLTLLAFVTTGGVALGPNTWAELVLLAIAVALGVTVLLRGAPGPAWGRVTLQLFVALTALTALSIAWSVQPDNSWIEANRAVSYVAVFAAALALARLVPERWPALIGGIALGSTVISGYALLVKVFPAVFDPGGFIGRVKAPFDYWNAVGLIAALGLPACLWIGSRRERGRPSRALCAPAITVLATTLLLSYSRSALLAAIVGVGLWFVVVPVRLRAAAILATGLAGAVATTAWALSTHPLTRDGAPLNARVAAGHAFGLWLVLVLAVIAAAGFAGSFAVDRTSLPDAVRRRIGTLLIVWVAMVPAGGVVALAASSRGFTGELSHVWHSLTNSNQVTGDVPGRLVKLGSTRSRYWSQALTVGEHAPLAGVGAGGYGVARARYTTDPAVVDHAHGYLVETFADLGLLGVALSLALLIGWALASARTIGGSKSSSPERAGMFTLLCVVAAFGVSSTIDWTWFVPGTAVPALLCAGWLAGRGPLSQRVGLLSRRRQISARPAMIALLTAVAGFTVLCGWAIWQPLHAVHADSAAVAALSRGDTSGALSNARAAVAADPVALEPRFELSAILSSAGNEPAARAELIQATRVQPQNPASWRQLGRYYLQHGRPADALAAVQRAGMLDHGSYETLDELNQVRAALGAATAAR